MTEQQRVIHHRTKSGPIARLAEHKIEDGQDVWCFDIGGVKITVEDADGTVTHYTSDDKGGLAWLRGWELAGPLSNHADILFERRGMGWVITAATPELYRHLEEAEAAWRRTGQRTLTVLLPPRPMDTGVIVRERPFTEYRGTVLSDPHSQAAIRGMWSASNRAPDAWKRGDRALPYYQDPESGVIVYLGNRTGSEFASPDAAERAWHQILSLDDDHVLTFLVCMAKWFHDSAGASALESTRVHVGDVLAFRSIKKHTRGGYRPEQKEEVRDDLLRLRQIWVRSEQLLWEQVGRSKRQKRVAVDSALLEVAIESELDLWGHATPYAFQVRPGEWARPYLSEPNRMTAVLLRPVLKYDASKGVGQKAMRLGVYLTMQWRIRAPHGTLTQPWQVETLLDRARIPIPTDRRLLSRFRDQVEGALDRLHQDGVIAGWEYARGEEDELPDRGAFKAWLKWTVRVTPPAAIIEAYARLPGERRRAIRTAQVGAATSRRRAEARRREALP